MALIVFTLLRRQRCALFCAIRAATHAGARCTSVGCGASAIARKSPVQSYLLATLLELGKTRPRAEEASTSFETTYQQCWLKSYLPLRIRPRYFLCARTSTRNELTSMKVLGVDRSNLISKRSSHKPSASTHQTNRDTLSGQAHRLLEIKFTPWAVTNVSSVKYQ